MKVLGILFLLGLAAGASSEKCPRRADLKPCYCENKTDYNGGYIMVRCEGDEMDFNKLNKSLSSLVGKKNVELEIKEMDLGTIPSNFFAGIEITRLRIAHCELDALSEDGLPALHGLEDSLDELSIIASFSEENVPAKLKLDHMKNLRKLYLIFNTIKELGNDWFDKGPASLRFLTIINNGIKIIGDRAFANLTNLKYILLSGERFGAINRTMLPSSADKLETLNLDFNALEKLPEDLFSNMPSLDDVSLRNNGIARLEQKTWEPVWKQLNDLYLDKNPLECDSHMSWMFALKSKTRLYGTCEAPKDKRGIRLQVFIDNEGH